MYIVITLLKRFLQTIELAWNDAFERKQNIAQWRNLNIKFPQLSHQKIFK